MNNYLFDVTLQASIRVNASSQKEAEEMVRGALDCASVNAGAWPDGSPLLFEASVENQLDLAEVNGEWV